MRRPLKRQIIAAALIVAPTAGCGTESELLEGTWTITGYHCDGASFTLPSPVTYSITYNSDGTYEAVLGGNGGCTVTETGIYQRDGLTVTETAEFHECGAGCTVPDIPPARSSTICVGTNMVASQRTYIVGIPGPTEMEQTRHDPHFLCESSDSTEGLLFEKD